MRSAAFSVPFLVLAAACTVPGAVKTLDGPWTLGPPGGPSRSITIPGTYPGTSSGWAVLAASVSLDPRTLPPAGAWVYLGDLDFPCEVTFNGDLLFRKGAFPPANTWVQMAEPVLFRVPPALWDPAGENRLSVKLFSPGPTVNFPAQVLVADGAFADFQLQVVQFFNMDFYLMFFGVNFIGGLYFLVIWAGRRQDLSRLYFALSSIFMGFYFFEMGSPVALFADPLYKAVMKGCLSFSIGFLVVFFMEYLGIYRQRWVRNLSLGIFGASGLFVALSTDTATTMARFTLALAPLEVSVVFVLTMMVRALRARNPDVFAVLVGSIILIVLGTHDVAYQILGLTPMVWLQGAGFFALQGSMFLSMALQSSRLYRTLEDYSSTLAAQQAELEETNKALGRFVPREFLAILGKKSITHVALGDQIQQHMTILFSDIRNFTALSEKLTPPQNFNLINAYLNRMAPEIKNHGGIIDSFIGDAIMALFGGGTDGAVLSALAMRDCLAEYNEGRLRAGYEPLEMGVGIHAGSLMLGTIGVENRMDTTVISDAVNTASRIEGLTKVFRVPIILSQNVLDEATPGGLRSSVRYLGRISVRGRSEGLGLFELVHGRDPWHREKLAHRAEFEDCVRAWEARNPGYLDRFEAYRKTFPQDPTLDFFLNKESLPRE